MEKIAKPWGYELIWAHTDSYVGKILSINAGERLSLQYHHIKDETIYVTKGVLLFTFGDDIENLEIMEMLPGEVYHIRPGMIHQMEAIKDCEIFEVSTDHLSDVVRLKDDYGKI